MYERPPAPSPGAIIGWAGLILATLIFLIGGSCYAVPKYDIYQKTAAGRAQLSEAESNRQIAVLEAKAKQEAAAYLAEADTVRAHGVAESNKIIGQSLKENHEYLTWLWIESLEKNGNQVIYVPTEANLPVLEAGRFVMGHKSDAPMAPSPTTK